MLISMIKAMKSQDAESDIILESIIPNCGELKYQLSYQTIFSRVFYFKRKNIPQFNSKSKIKKFLFQHRYYRNIMQEQIKYQLNIAMSEYDHIYLFNDRSIWGYYFCSANINYHLVEDAVDYYKYIERVNTRPEIQKQVLDMVNPKLFKNKIKRLFNYDFFLLGQSRNAISIEVNENKNLFIPNSAKIVEMPKKDLFSNLSTEEKKIICQVLLKDQEKLIDIPSKSVLILTQPLFAEASVDSFQTQVELYNNIASKYKEDGFKVYIKPHPRDKAKYDTLNNCTILDKDFPIELLNWVPNVFFHTAITLYSSAIYEIKPVEKKVILGFKYAEEYDSQKESRIIIDHLFDENAISITLSSSNYFVPYLSVVLVSILENIDYNNKYEIYILNKDISLCNQESILAIVEKYENVRLKFVNIDMLVHNQQLKVTKALPIETWFRIYIPDLFRNHSKMIYLDSDLVVNNNLAELFNIDVDNYYIGAVTEDPAAIGIFNGPNPQMTKYLVEELNIQSPWNYFQGGVLLMNLNAIRENYPLDTLLEAAKLKKWKTSDQDMMNYLFAGKVKSIPLQWNVVSQVDYRQEYIDMAPARNQMLYYEAKKNPYIVHYAGKYKPWNRVTVDMSFYFWSYAKKSPFYEYIIYRKIQEVSNVPNPSPYSNKFVNLLPKGSKRREFVKRMVKRRLK